MCVTEPLKLLPMFEFLEFTADFIDIFKDEIVDRAMQFDWH